MKKLLLLLIVIAGMSSAKAQSLEITFPWKSVAEPVFVRQHVNMNWGISWKSEGVDSVRIEYRIHPDSPFKWIDDTAVTNNVGPNETVYWWKMKEKKVTNRAVIRISDLHNPAVYDESDEFQIIAADHSVSFISPTPSETIKENKPYVFKWKQEGAFFKIRLSYTTPSSGSGDIGITDADSIVWAFPMPIGLDIPVTFHIETVVPYEPFPRIAADDVNVFIFPDDSAVWLGMNDVLSENAYTIYPNPSEGDMQVLSEGRAPDRVNIFDLSGRLVSSYKDQSEIHVSEPGLYIAQVISGHASAYRKIVIR